MGITQGGTQFVEGSQQSQWLLRGCLSVYLSVVYVSVCLSVVYVSVCVHVPEMQRT